MKKVILKVIVHDDKEKKKAMKAVSAIPGIESIVIDMKEQKLTVTGIIDPVEVVEKLRKILHAEIVGVGPKEDKKDEGKKADAAKKAYEDYLKACEEYWKHHSNGYYPPPPCYNVVPLDDGPNNCVIS